MELTHLKRKLGALRPGAVLAVFIAAMALTGCKFDEPQSILNPKGPMAQMQMDVFMRAIWVILGVFIVVGGAMLYAVVRFRAKPGDNEVPKQVHGNTPLEISFALVSVFLLILIAIPNIRTIFAMGAAPEGDRVNVHVVGHQWWWEFEYPDLGIRTANELHIPVGTVIDFKVETADVIHSFWAPQFAGKIDAMPNQINRLWLQADEVGTFKGQCAELCGDSHANMRFLTVVDTQEDFDAWVEVQKSAGSTPATTDTLAARGATVFIGNACIGCHAIAGTPAMARVGPDLTHVGSRQTIASAILENNDENLTQWIMDPPAVKPGSLMPKLGLTEEDTRALVAYLRQLK